MTATQITSPQTSTRAQRTPAPATARIGPTTSVRRLLRTAAVAALTAGGLALAGASAAHAATDTAKLQISTGTYPEAIVTGQFGTATLGEAKALKGSSSVRVDLWGDDVYNDDYLGSLHPVYEAEPTTSALPFSGRNSACSSLAGKDEWLNEDDSLFNRTDEIYARVSLLDAKNQVMRSIKTNVVSTEIGPANVGFSVCG